MITNGLLLTNQKIEKLINEENFKVLAISIDTIGNVNRDVTKPQWEELLQQLKQILEMNDGVDLVWIPRVNTIEGMEQHHIQKWGWRVTENGWVNYPDYQSRVFKNSNKIRWQNKVHERIFGAKTYAHLPPHEELSLYHPKTIDKQIKQNKFYEGIL